eukprot:2066208-Amphidinium_carterae.1
MQQVLSSSSSIKELQRQGSVISSTKWTEAYIWCSIKDAGYYVLGSIRPSHSSTTRTTMASTVWHLHRDPIFTLTASYYHQ